MAVIYMEQTVNLFVSKGKKIEIENLIRNGEVKQTESGIKYLKVIEK